ncbi:hypothetical protein, partial [Stenotrophomonas pavanii]|uniref:hypothetical protein n=1 Tax=Stenotrophomonas pavanii TaxID=487698 RepID=UPI002E77EF96
FLFARSIPAGVRSLFREKGSDPIPSVNSVNTMVAAATTASKQNPGAATLSRCHPYATECDLRP